MPRRPIDLYRSLIDTVPGEDEADRAATLRRVLAGDRGAMGQPLRAVVDAADVSRGYLLRHVLPVWRFAPEVRAAMDRGLPLAVARLVNGVRDPEARARVLEPLWAAAAGDGVLLPRGLAAQVERSARAERAREEQGPGERGGAASAAKGRADRFDEAMLTSDGWLAPERQAARPRRQRGDVWIYPRPRWRRGAVEPLDDTVVEGLLARTLPQGGRLVDVTAASGTIALVARRFGVDTWSGDVEPKAAFVHRADARSLLVAGHPALHRGVADVLVVHPPTYPAWAERHDADGLGGLQAYVEDVAAMVTGSLGVVRPRGFVVLVTRPAREPRRVSLTTSHLAELLTDAGLALEGYVVAVAERGGEDWHVLLARVPVVD